MHVKTNPSSITNTQNYQYINSLPYATTDPTIDIATISNVVLDPNSIIDSVIDLPTFDMSHSDFMACFYPRPGGAFSVNAVNKSFQPLLLTGQRYITTGNTSFQWDLYHDCIKAYCDKNFVSENSISSFKRIALNKEAFRTQTLASNCCYQISLGWDMVLSNLTTTNQISFTENSDNHANVVFRVVLIYYSAALDVTLEIHYSYRTSLPGYVNAYNTNNMVDPAALLPYSKNEAKEVSVIPNFEGIADLLEDENISRNKKNKKKEKKEKVVTVTPNTVEDNIQLNVNHLLDNDNESVATKLIITSSENNNDLDTNSIPEEDFDSNEDDNDNPDDDEGDENGDDEEDEEDEEDDSNQKKAHGKNIRLEENNW